MAFQSPNNIHPHKPHGSNHLTPRLLVLYYSRTTSVPLTRFRTKDSFPSLCTAYLEYLQTIPVKTLAPQRNPLTTQRRIRTRLHKIKHGSGLAPRKSRTFRADHRSSQAKRAEMRDLLTKEACRESTGFLAGDGIGGFPPPPPSLGSSMSAAGAAGSLVAQGRAAGEG
jgi:hypothetical protein